MVRQPQLCCFFGPLLCLLNLCANENKNRIRITLPDVVNALQRHAQPLITFICSSIYNRKSAFEVEFPLQLFHHLLLNRSLIGMQGDVFNHDNADIFSSNFSIFLSMGSTVIASLPRLDNILSMKLEVLTKIGFLGKL